jgi:hypothetical protein
MRMSKFASAVPQTPLETQMACSPSSIAVGTVLGTKADALIALSCGHMLDFAEYSYLGNEDGVSKCSN